MAPQNLPMGAHARPLAADTLARLKQHAGLRRRRWLGLGVLGMLVAAAFVADLRTGATPLSLWQLLQALMVPGDSLPETLVIVHELRLPHALLAVLVGAMLSLAGAEMQTILDNPLASPFTLGVSSAASLGAALAFTLGLGLPGISMEWLVPVNTFVFAFSSVLLLQFAAQMGGRQRQVLLLTGIAMVFSFNAAVALLQYIAAADALQELVFWSMGSLSRANWTHLQILALVLLAVLPVSLRAAWSLNVLRLGDERARSLGLNVRSLRFWSLLRVSALAATAVAFVGTIGFVGLIGPHIARMLLGEDHRYFLPGSALVGALLLSLASIASKTLVPGVVLPVGIVTALVGVPVFLWLLFRRKGAA